MKFLSDVVTAARREGWVVVAKEGTKMALMVACKSCNSQAMVMVKGKGKARFSFCTCGKQHKA